MGGYQLLGDLHITLPGHAYPARYQRSLDIGQSLAHVTYTVGGVTYQRECFASHPAQVLVVRLTADRPGAYTGTIDLADSHGSQSTVVEGQHDHCLPSKLVQRHDVRDAGAGGELTAARSPPRPANFISRNADSLTLFVGGRHQLCDGLRPALSGR